MGGGKTVMDLPAHTFFFRSWQVDSGATRFSKPPRCKALFCDPCDRDQPRRFGVDALQQQWRENFLDGHGPSSSSSEASEGADISSSIYTSARSSKCRSLRMAKFCPGQRQATLINFISLFETAWTAYSDKARSDTRANARFSRELFLLAAIPRALHRAESF